MQELKLTDKQGKQIREQLTEEYKNQKSLIKKLPLLNKQHKTGNRATRRKLQAEIRQLTKKLSKIKGGKFKKELEERLNYLNNLNI